MSEPKHSTETRTHKTADGAVKSLWVTPRDPKAQAPEPEEPRVEYPVVETPEDAK